MTKHVPVLQNEALDGAHIKTGMTVVDATLGGGGYTREIFSRVGDSGHVIAIDRDKTAIDRFRMDYPRIAEKVDLVHANFADIARIVHDRGVVPMAIIADLGISSDQLDDPQRGLSFSEDGPLDMRLDQSGYADGDTPTARELLATLSVSALARIFRRYGDEPFALPIARRIVAYRKKSAITTTRELANIVTEVVPCRFHRATKHPATRVFQALRIAVNHEYDDLETFLRGAMDVLAPGGYLAVISFHSGEDAIVKHFMREQARGCMCPPHFPICQCGTRARGDVVTKKPITPSSGEIAANPRARSAKLRIMRKNAL